MPISRSLQSRRNQKHVREEAWQEEQRGFRQKKRYKSLLAGPSL